LKVKQFLVWQKKRSFPGQDLIELVNHVDTRVTASQPEVLIKLHRASQTEAAFKVEMKR